MDSCNLQSLPLEIWNLVKSALSLNKVIGVASNKKFHDNRYLNVVGVERFS